MFDDAWSFSWSASYFRCMDTRFPPLRLSFRGQLPYVSICLCIHTYITLHYTTLYSIPIHYITLHCITLHCITVQYITLHYITFITWIQTSIHPLNTYITCIHYITLHNITLHYFTLHYSTLLYITLHDITIQHNTAQYKTYVYIYIYTYTCVRCMCSICSRWKKSRYSHSLPPFFVAQASPLAWTRWVRRRWRWRLPGDDQAPCWIWLEGFNT